MTGVAGAQPSALAYNWKNNLMYVMVISNSNLPQLCTVDLATGELTLIGTGAEGIIVAMDFANDGLLYGPAIDTDQLYSIDPTTGAVTAVGSIGIDLNYSQDVSFDASENRLYTYTCGNPPYQFGYYDLATGTFNPISDVPKNDYVITFVITKLGISAGPYAVSKTPTTNATGIDLDAEVSVTFNTNIAAVDLLGISITPDPGSVLASVNGNKLTIAHGNFTNETLYTVTVPAGAVSDGADANVNPITWSFTTTPPKYTVTFAVVDSENVAIEGATVIINSETATTNSSGVATMNLINGSYPYAVSKTGYAKATGDAVVNGAGITVNLTLHRGYILTLQASPTEGGTINSEINGNYHAGEILTVKATPAANYYFVNWTKGEGEVSANAQFDYTIPSEDVTLIANFAPCTPATNVQATASGSDVVITWNPPENNAVLEYIITRDGTDYDYVGATETAYTDAYIGNGTYEYCVVAVYETGATDPACAAPVTVNVVCDPATNVQAIASGAGVVVTWESPENEAQHSYTITRDGVVIATDVTETIYTDNSAIHGTIEYCVTTVYAAGPSTPACATPIVFYGTPVSVQAELSGASVNITWNAPVGAPLLSEGFDSGIPADWTQIDANSDGRIWYHSTEDGHNSNGCAASQSHVGGNITPDNYLITPLVEGATRVNYWVKATHKDCAEHYSVMVSSTGINATDFTEEFSETLTIDAFYNWQERTVDLPAGTKYIAFRHHNCTGQLSLLLDDITVYGASSVESYTITKNGTKLATGVTATTHTDSDIANGNTYEYCVKAVHIDGTSEPVCATPVEFYNPATNVQASASGANVTITWTAAIDAGNCTYTITREGTEIAKGITATTYADNNVFNGTHEYCVKAVYATGSSAPACAAPVTIDIFYEPVTSVQATVSEANVTITWTAPANTDERTYTIIRNDLVIATGVTETTYADNNVVNGTYEYCVKAVYAADASVPACAAPVTIDILYEPVTSVQATANGANVTITWTAPVNTSERTYTITRDGVEIATGVTETTYADNNVANGTYEYCVKAVYAADASAPACAGPVTVAVHDPVKVTGVSLCETTKTIKKGESFTLTATVSPSDATNPSVTWSSDDESVATVSGGKVSALKAGVATITVKTEDGGKTATCVVTVEGTEVAVTGVSLSETTKTIKKGESFTLTATVSPSDATNPSVTWSSDDESVATVSGGKVSALKAGVATITVKTVDGGKTATCRVTVEDATPVDAAALHLTLFPNPASSQVGIVGLSSPADVAIYNSLGGVVLSVFVQPNQSIDVSALPAGVYLLRVEGVVLRFVKE